MKKLALITLILFLAIPTFSWQRVSFSGTFLNSIEEVVKAKQLEGRIKTEKIKIWPLPIYMSENLNYMRNEFTRLFDAKITAYKQELKARFIEFRDLPDDVILTPDFKTFIRRSDYLKILEQQVKNNKEKRK